jgi:hypothetical protein
MEAREVSEGGSAGTKEGKVKKDAPVSVETLEEVGYTRRARRRS